MFLQYAMFETSDRRMQAEAILLDGEGDIQSALQFPKNKNGTRFLRYYPFGRAFTSDAGQSIVEIALTQEGNIGGLPYWSWYGFDSRVEWYACFISWCANEVGYIDNGLIPKFSGCVQGEQWFKDRNQWFDKTYEP